MKVDNSDHYNHVTDAWQDIMGNNFHFGYFTPPENSLSQATDALIDKMAGLANIAEGTKILDVGCGIGSPAMYLAKKYNCSVCGITTSEKGVEVARKRSQSNGYAGRLEFKVADGTNNGEADSSYDVVWAMESSHLMAKPPLLNECYRVLKPKGTLLLCDLIFVYDSPIGNIIKITKINAKYRHRFVYGDVKLWSLQKYWKTMHQIGFNEITTCDVSKEAYPTMERWRQNVIRNESDLLRTNKYSKKELSDYLQSCDRLEDSFDQKVVGYAVIKAIKP